MDDLERWVTRLVALAGVVGAAVAGAWPWLWRWWKEARQEAEAEQERNAIPYRKAFEAQQKALEKTQAGLEKLSAEHVESLVRIARLEAENVNCRETNEHLRAELERQKQESAQLHDRLQGLHGRFPDARHESPAPEGS